jgi:hypothetical protein
MHDAFEYMVHVRKTDRLAFVTRTGGYFGVYETLGPIALSDCLRDTFKPTDNA